MLRTAALAIAATTALTLPAFAGSMGKKDIVDTAVGAGTFETLVPPSARPT